MFLNDAVGDGEAQSRAAPVPGPGHGLGGEERIVNTLEVLGSDAAAGIGNQRGHLVQALVGQRGHAEAAAAGHGFFGVQQQVEKDLL